MESLATWPAVLRTISIISYRYHGQYQPGRETAEPREQAELLDAAENAARRAVGLTRQLLAFAHGAAP
jgi:hypothetical protein